MLGPGLIGSVFGSEAALVADVEEPAGSSEPAAVAVLLLAAETGISSSLILGSICNSCYKFLVKISKQNVEFGNHGGLTLVKLKSGGRGFLFGNLISG